MNCLPQNKAQRRYMARFFPMMGLYVICLLSITWLFRHHPPTGPMAYILAALPSLPIIGVLVIIGLYIAEETDEFERSILVQSMLWGLGVALSISTIWGSLEDFANAPHLSTFNIFLFFWIVMGISQPFIRRRYQ